MQRSAVLLALLLLLLNGCTALNNTAISNSCPSVPLPPTEISPLSTQPLPAPVSTLDTFLVSGNGTKTTPHLALESGQLGLVNASDGTLILSFPPQTLVTPSGLVLFAVRDARTLIELYGFEGTKRTFRELPFGAYPTRAVANALLFKDGTGREQALDARTLADRELPTSQERAAADAQYRTDVVLDDKVERLPLRLSQEHGNGPCLAALPYHSSSLDNVNVDYGSTIVGDRLYVMERYHPVMYVFALPAGTLVGTLRLAADPVRGPGLRPEYSFLGSDLAATQLYVNCGSAVCVVSREAQLLARWPIKLEGLERLLRVNSDGSRAYVERPNSDQSVRDYTLIDLRTGKRGASHTMTGGYVQGIFAH